MTRKDYCAIAEGLRKAYEGLNEETRAEFHPGYRYAVIQLAATLAAGNALFDRAKFLKACGVPV